LNLSSKLNYYKNKHSESLVHNFEHAVNPIYAFSLIKRTTSEWQEVQQIMAQNTSHTVLRNISLLRSVFPFANNDDLNGAAVALTRLQEVYQLETSNVSNGFLLDVRFIASRLANS
jgi:prolyl 4-hydroxylase